MADKTKTTSTLVLVGEFADGDERVITLDNPVASVEFTIYGVMQ